MRIERFTVRGYKNLSSVTLADLGWFNVLHGDNNVGKSNLLEAIALLFLALHVIDREAKGALSEGERHARRSVSGPEDLGQSRAAVRSDRFLAGEGFPPDEVFARRTRDDGQPPPIELEARLILDGVEVQAGSAVTSEEIVWTVAVRMERLEEEVRFALVESDVDAPPDQDGADTEGLKSRLLGLVVGGGHGRSSRSACVLLRADRTLLRGQLDLEPGSVLPRELPLLAVLASKLYDSQSATAARERRLFERFQEAMGPFEPVLGPGRWGTRYDRRAERAEIFYEESSGVRVPLAMLGSGVQQIVSLLVVLLVTNARVLAVEEPELNLRFENQLRLREILERLSASGSPRMQLLLSSHSPAFEVEPCFYALRRTPDGPQVERRPREQARQFLMPEVAVPPGGSGAPVCYVSTDGLVQVPPEVREVLGLMGGGGVVFVREKDHGHYRMLTDEQFLDMLEPTDTAR